MEHIAWGLKKKLIIDADNDRCKSFPEVRAYLFISNMFYRHNIGASKEHFIK